MKRSCFRAPRMRLARFDFGITTSALAIRFCSRLRNDLSPKYKNGEENSRVIRHFPSFAQVNYTLAHRSWCWQIFCTWIVTEHIPPNLLGHIFLGHFYSCQKLTTPTMVHATLIDLRRKIKISFNSTRNLPNARKTKPTRESLFYWFTSSAQHSNTHELIIYHFCQWEGEWFGTAKAAGQTANAIIIDWNST